MGSFFDIKDQTKLEHNNDKVLELAEKDKKSHLLRDTLQSGHPASLNDFKVLGKGFNNNRVKRKHQWPYQLNNISISPV